MLQAEADYNDTPTPHTHAAWLHCSRKYELRLLDLTEKRMLYTSQKFF